jgi:hypothetical protein
MEYLLSKKVPVLLNNIKTMASMKNLLLRRTLKKEMMNLIRLSSMLMIKKIPNMKKKRTLNNN